MSAKRRGAKGIQDDAYPTPPWCVRRLLEAVGIGTRQGGPWLEPAVGDGAIVEACGEFGYDSVDWTFVDLIDGQDYLTWDPPAEQFDVAITNPPFTLTFDFAKKMRREARHVLLLTRLNFLEAAERTDWLRKDMPDVHVLPNRPSFAHKLTCETRGCKGAMVAWNAPTPELTACDCGDALPLPVRRKAGNDATGYCWLHWHGAPKRDGKISVLAETPKSERVDRARPTYKSAT